MLSSEAGKPTVRHRPATAEAKGCRPAGRQTGFCHDLPEIRSRRKTQSRLLPRFLLPQQAGKSLASGGHDGCAGRLSGRFLRQSAATSQECRQSCLSRAPSAADPFAGDAGRCEDNSCGNRPILVHGNAAAGFCTCPSLFHGRASQDRACGRDRVRLSAARDHIRAQVPWHQVYATHLSPASPGDQTDRLRAEIGGVRPHLVCWIARRYATKLSWSPRSQAPMMAWP